MNKKQTSAIMTIVAAIAAVGTIGIIAGAPAANAQDRAPGQHGCNPGLLVQPTCGPPGHAAATNPGQCQKSFQDDPFIDKETAHRICQEND